jgi:hypothetical protein
MFLPGTEIPCIRVFTAGFAGSSIFLLPYTEASLFKIYVYFRSFIQGTRAVSSSNSVVVEVICVESSIPHLFTFLTLMENCC